MKKEDVASGVVVRMFGVTDADQGKVCVGLNVARPLKSAALTNLIELDPQEIPGVAGGNQACLNVGMWSIETMKMDVL